MSEVRISLSNGRRLHWSGDREGGLCVIDEMESEAKATGITFDKLAGACLEAVFDGGEQEYVSMATVILAYVLQRETEEHAGRFVDFLDDTDYEFKIVAYGQFFHFTVIATSRLQSHACEP
jgi:hypothetical protein